jgi:hypothetical protein
VSIWTFNKKVQGEKKGSLRELGLSQIGHIDLTLTKFRPKLLT